MKRVIEAVCIALGALFALNILVFIVLYLVLSGPDIHDMTDKYGDLVKWIDLAVLVLVAAIWYSTKRHAREQKEDEEGSGM